MSATIIDGKQVAGEIRTALAARIAVLREQGIQPCLAAVLVGDDPASQKYVTSKERTCAQLGIKGIVHRLPSTTSQDKLRALIAELNADTAVHGILVSCPAGGAR